MFNFTVKKIFISYLLVLLSLNANAEDKAVVAEASAQSTDSRLVNFGLQQPPDFSVHDSNSVNLVTGKRSISKQDLTIGAGESKLAHTISTYQDYFYSYSDNFVGLISAFSTPALGARRQVSFNGVSSTFNYNPSENTHIDANGEGAQLIDNGNGSFTYTHGSGTEVIYSSSISLSSDLSTGKFVATATEARYPNEEVINLHFKSGTFFGSTFHRIQSVTSNTGLQLKYQYQVNNPTSDSDFEAWFQPQELIAINNAIEFCDPNADSCNLTNTWPSVTYSWPSNVRTNGGDFIITAPGGYKTTYKHNMYCQFGSGREYCDSVNEFDNNNPRIHEIIESTSSGTITSSFEYVNQIHCFGTGLEWICNVVKENIMEKSSRGAANWTYAYQVPASEHASPIHSVSGSSANKYVWLNPYTGAPDKIFDHEQGAEFILSNDNHVTSIIYEYGSTTVPDYNGISVHFDYDSLGNLITRTEKPKTGSTSADIISTANYENNCANVKTQKKPAWVKDANNNQTDFTYHCASGNIASITKPAGANSLRPQTRYSYEQQYAWYKNNAGVIVQADTPIWLLTQESYCKAGAASATGCAIENDEVITTYDYGSGSAIKGNNLFLKGIAVIADSETLRTCYSYDNYGNKLSETQPKAALASCP